CRTKTRRHNLFDLYLRKRSMVLVRVDDKSIRGWRNVDPGRNFDVRTFNKRMIEHHAMRSRCESNNGLVPQLRWMVPTKELLRRLEPGQQISIDRICRRKQKHWSGCRDDRNLR